MENRASPNMIESPTNAEVIISRCRANMFVRPSEALGGHVTLTNQRLMFTPHALEKPLRAVVKKLPRVVGFLSLKSAISEDVVPSAWECALSSITSVTIAPGGGKISEGALRRRLLVTANGTSTYLLVPRVDRVLAAIEAAMPV